MKIEINQVLRPPAKNTIESWVKINLVFVDVFEQLICAKNLCYPHKLRCNATQLLCYNWETKPFSRLKRMHGWYHDTQITYEHAQLNFFLIIQ